MNIITGCARGTKLTTLDGDATRPTLQRAKEAMFSAIQFDLENKNILDLFAGSGSLGLEALSRGAAKVTFIDKSVEAFGIIRDNALKTKLYKQCNILNMDYAEYLRSAKKSDAKFDIVFLDPPYESGLLVPALEQLVTCGILNEGALVIAEWDRDTLLSDNPSLLTVYKELKAYKSGRIYFWKLTPEA